MSWVRVNAAFSGTCMECRKWIKRGEQVLWSRGVGVKHIECAEGAKAKHAGRTGQTVQIGLEAVHDSSIACAVCGGPAGCSMCELADSCDTKKVSQLCICSRCNTGDSMAAYTAAVSKKFPALSGR